MTVGRDPDVRARPPQAREAGRDRQDQGGSRGPGLKRKRAKTKKFALGSVKFITCTYGTICIVIFEASTMCTLLQEGIFFYLDY